MPKVITFDDEDGTENLPQPQQKMQVGNPEKV